MKFIDATTGADVTRNGMGLCACCGAHVYLSDPHAPTLNIVPEPLRGLAFTPNLDKHVPSVTGRTQKREMITYDLVPVIVTFPDGERLLITETHLQRVTK